MITLFVSTITVKVVIKTKYVNIPLAQRNSRCSIVMEPLVPSQSFDKNPVHLLFLIYSQHE